jgi:hypothetical protein
VYKEATVAVDVDEDEWDEWNERRDEERDGETVTMTRCMYPDRRVDSFRLVARRFFTAAVRPVPEWIKKYGGKARQGKGKGQGSGIGREGASQGKRAKAQGKRNRKLGLDLDSTDLLCVVRVVSTRLACSGDATVYLRIFTVLRGSCGPRLQHWRLAAFRSRPILEFLDPLTECCDGCNGERVGTDALLRLCLTLDRVLVCARTRD